MHGLFARWADDGTFDRLLTVAHGQAEAQVQVQVQVAVLERGEPGHVRFANLVALGAELGDGGVDVLRGPQHDGVEDQAERAELVLSELAQLGGRSANEPSFTTEGSREEVLGGRVPPGVSCTMSARASRSYWEKA